MEEIGMKSVKPSREDVLRQLAEGRIDVETAISMLADTAEPGVQQPPAGRTERMHILEQLESGMIDAAEALAAFEQPETMETGAPSSMDVLSLIEAGELSAEEAVARLEDQGDGMPQGESKHVRGTVDESGEERESIRSRSRWIMLSIGTLLSAIGGWLGSLGGWWWMAAVPLLLIGLPLLVLVVLSWHSIWLFVSINTSEDWPRRIVFSLPVPLKLAGWAIRNFGSALDPLQKSALDELLVTLEENVRHSEPISIEVDEGDGGERVRVYLG